MVSVRPSGQKCLEQPGLVGKLQQPIMCAGTTLRGDRCSRQADVLSMHPENPVLFISAQDGHRFYVDSFITDRCCSHDQISASPSLHLERTHGLKQTAEKFRVLANPGKSKLPQISV